MSSVVVVALLAACGVAGTLAQTSFDPHYAPGHNVMVHLFEWKFSDIAEECERYLGPAGFGGVQVSPINENLIIPGRPWYERYQPMSYRIKTRSGDEAAFRDMVARCNRAGVRVYVDAVINHMTGSQSPAVGTAGSTADTQNLSYPGVPYSREDFHAPCAIDNYNDARNVRDCELSGLHDLDQRKPYVRQAIVDFLNRAVDLGVAGFRIDAAKHMWPEDLREIYSRVKDLREDVYGPQQRPYVCQEVIDLGGEAVSKKEYNFSAVIEFQYGVIMGYMFNGKDNLRRLSSLVNTDEWNLVPNALVMIDNHDNQRGHGAGGDMILTYKAPKQYKMAIAFMLAFDYGTPRIMSSFNFTDPSVGPPMDKEENIVSPEIGPDGQCKNGWVCEHRWPAIRRMVQFSNVVKGAVMANWWRGDNQIAFSRSNKGFVAFNAAKTDLNQRIKSGLPVGTYCDVVTGEVVDGKCTGRSFDVGEEGVLLVDIPANAAEGVIALHVDAKL